MNTRMSEPDVIRGITNIFGRTVAGVVGVGLMVRGIAMGVTTVMLPVGIVVGLAGAMLLAGAVLPSFEPR